MSRYYQTLDTHGSRATFDVLKLPATIEAMQKAVAAYEKEQAAARLTAADLKPGTVVYFYGSPRLIVESRGHLLFIDTANHLDVGHVPIEQAVSYANRLYSKSPREFG